MMWKNLLSWFRAHLIATIAASGVIGGLGGAVIGDFANWRAANRDYLKTQADAGQKADQDLIGIIRKFSDKALGKASTTDDDLRNLKASVGKSYLVAASLTERLPAVKDDFDQYAEALIALQKSAEKLTGPADGQSFVEAVSAFADKRQKFERRIASLQTRWPL
jgi:hypothetical protein